MPTHHPRNIETEKNEKIKLTDICDSEKMVVFLTIIVKKKLSNWKQQAKYLENKESLRVYD